MVTSSYRLENVALQLIERLEGARRSYRDRPEALDGAAAEISAEVLAPILREHRELIGDAGHGAWLEGQIHEVFLPRYLAAARAQNDIERRGYDTRIGRDPLVRLGSFVVAALFATALYRVMPGFLGMLAWAAALAVPLTPEIRGISYKRQYQTELQSIVDDLGRIQRQVESHAPSIPELESDARGAPTVKKRPPPQSERR